LLGNLDIFDTPYSLTSYTAEAIENQQATTMGAVLENNPSVRSISAGAMWDTFMIRGFQVSSSGYSLNGLPGIAPGSMVAPEFIDRAELFLGPTGMLSNMPLYGATGGAVNLVTKKANDKPLTPLTTGFLSDGQSASISMSDAAMVSTRSGESGSTASIAMATQPSTISKKCSASRPPRSIITASVCARH
jgi:iron complex outermembrane receptor protein